MTQMDMINTDFLELQRFHIHLRHQCSIVLNNQVFYLLQVALKQRIYCRTFVRCQREVENSQVVEHMLCRRRPG